MRKIEPEIITGMGYIGDNPGVLYRMGGAGEQTVVTGNPALLENVKGSRFTSFTLHGKSTQASTTGAQLFPPPSLGSEEKNGITLDYMEDGKIHIRGTAEITTDFYVSRLQLSAVTYTFFVGTNIDSKVLRIALCDDFGVPYLDIKEDSLYTTDTIKSAIDVSLLIRVYAGKSIDLTVQPMLNIGSAALPYEPYTGGKPSPSPEYPQEIKSAGQDGEIGVEVLSGNLFDKSAAYDLTQSGGWSASFDGEELKVVGNNITIGSIRLFNYKKILPAGTYTFSISKPLPFEIRIDNYFLIKKGDTSATVTFDNGVSMSHFAVDAEPGATFNEQRFKIMLNAGSTALPYELYKPAQTLIIPTPNGLPGIRVSSGGNYTDADGKQWVCDEVDLANGEMVQRIGKTVVDGGKVKFVTSPNSIYWNLPRRTSPGISDGIAHISRYFADGTFAGNSTYNFAWTTSERMKSYFDTPEELNAFCVQKNSEGNPLTIYYCIETPIRTPLSPETIAAYKALHTYSPTTTVINDAGAGMSAGYRRK